MSKLSEVNMTDYERAMLAVLRDIRDNLYEMRQSMAIVECILGCADFSPEEFRYSDLSPEEEKELVRAELKAIHEGLSKH